jgi:uncharacterized protein
MDVRLVFTLVLGSSSFAATQHSGARLQPSSASLETVSGLFVRNPSDSSEAISTCEQIRPTFRLLGSYKTSSGQILGITPRPGSNSWRFIDYESGEAHRLFADDSLRFHSAADWQSEQPTTIHYSFETDSAGTIRALVIRRGNRPPVRAQRLIFCEDTVTFRSVEVKLFGKLVRPEHGGPFPAVVFVQGSDTTSVVAEEEFPYLMAAHGLASFVYDKRGTGKSEGHYFQKFQPLSDDVVAAVHWLQGRKEIDGSHIGVAGFSQGGWIAPLAAYKEPAISFVVVAYGLAEPVASQDSLEAPEQLRSLGFSEQDVGQFKDLNLALHRAALAGFANGWGEIDSLLAKYRDAPWLAAMKGTPTWSGSVLAMGLENAKAQAPKIFQDYFDPYYDPMPALTAIKVPMLWLLAGDDITAPPRLTLEHLAQLRESGHKIQTIVFPHADHGLVEYKIENGHRATVKYADGYFTTMVKWIRQQAFTRR